MKHRETLLSFFVRIQSHYETSPTFPLVSYSHNRCGQSCSTQPVGWKIQSEYSCPVEWLADDEILNQSPTTKHSAVVNNHKKFDGQMQSSCTWPKKRLCVSRWICDSFLYLCVGLVDTFLLFYRSSSWPKKGEERGPFTIHQFQMKVVCFLSGRPPLSVWSGQRFLPPSIFSLRLVVF